MEFGLFQGGFVHRDMAAANPNAEHDRLMSEVELCEVGDQHNWKYAWFTEHHFLRGVLAHLRQRGVDAVGAGPHRATSTSAAASST